MGIACHQGNSGHIPADVADRCSGDRLMRLTRALQPPRWPTARPGRPWPCRTTAGEGRHPGQRRGSRAKTAKGAAGA